MRRYPANARNDAGNPDTVKPVAVVGSYGDPIAVGDPEVTSVTVVAGTFDQPGSVQVLDAGSRWGFLVQNQSDSSIMLALGKDATGDHGSFEVGANMTWISPFRWTGSVSLYGDTGQDYHVEAW